MHLYIHVPFCARRCSYCDFAIAVRRETPSREFVEAIKGEWLLRKEAWPATAPLTTLYFGGGTPSRLEPTALADLIGFFRNEIGIAPGAEITIEANPDDINLLAAQRWAAAGVNRISLGVQSHDPVVLQWMHRTHTVEQVPVAVTTLRDAGIANISVDLIFALPAAQSRDWSRDLALTFELEPNHISLYGLTVEAHTPLARWTERGESTPLPDDRYAVEYLQAHRELLAHGFDHYEVSNAALPGAHSQHNSCYWQGQEYLGLGPSAHSFQGGRRAWNTPAWAAYKQQVQKGENPTEGTEEIDSAARRLEERYLGLRTREGLSVAKMPPKTAEEWARAGWATLSGGQISLTIEGWLRLDALVASVRDS